MKQLWAVVNVFFVFIEAIKQYGGVTETRAAAQRSVGASSSSSKSANAGDTALSQSVMHVPEIVVEHCRKRMDFGGLLRSHRDELQSRSLRLEQAISMPGLRKSRLVLQVMHRAYIDSPR